ncbi:DUF4097 family beta strand repeat-containing protein [Cecembia calidifontis]|uniref:Putative adhesin n=1 Tax=Cecembia calidifontis TaxID=1187080 RepID=A0A4Q7PEJ9_9BACT|nr:DUF4097 family beta strand repeat-containing protein [Cecembia calidifontis]RZS98080.1 putative adhesin [Cecembia calidifontis]
MKNISLQFGFKPLFFRSKITQSLRLFLIGLVLSSLTSCLGDDLSVVSEIQQDFEGITKIEVDAEFLEVQYTGASGRQVLSLNAELRSNSNKKFEVKYRVVGSTLVVTVETNNRLFSGGAKGEGFIRLTGPRNMLLDLEADSGKVTVENVVSNSAEIEVGSGEIFVKNVAIPRLNVELVSGRGKLEDVLGDIEGNVSSGKLEIIRVEGNVEASVSSGEIILRDVTGLVTAQTSSGKIEMSNVRSIGSIYISSGQLFATNSGLSPQTALRASSGNIYIQTTSNLRDFNYNITVGSGSARVGTSQSTSGTLNINNGSSTTIRGEVGSGKIEIVN